MFTKQEKDFVLMIFKTVVPTGRNRQEVKQTIELLEIVEKKVEAMPVEEPVEPPKDALSSELIKAVGQETKTSKRHRK